MGYAQYETVFGTLYIGYDNSAITHFTVNPVKKEIDGVRTVLTDLAYAQFMEYLSGKRKDFDLPIHIFGTPFQLLVWEALKTIPYGETRSYQQIAEQIGHPKAYRAVGQANNRNPIAVIIPCHRVIGANRKPVGYACGLDMKMALLSLEEQNKSNFE